jgi:hypothetical protein
VGRRERAKKKFKPTGKTLSIDATLLPYFVFQFLKSGQ